MAIKNTHTTLRVVLLSVLLVHAPQALQERIERNADEIPDEDLLKNERKSVGVRKMLSEKHVIGSKAQFSKDEDAKFESFLNTKTVTPSYVEGATTSVEAKTLVLKGFESSSSGSSKSSTWGSGGEVKTSWSSSSYSFIRSASTYGRTLTSTTVPSDSWTRKGVPGHIPSLTTALDEPAISKREAPTEDPLSKAELVKSPITQEGPVKVLPSESESHQAPFPMTPSTLMSPSTSPSEDEELTESPEESPNVPPELVPWSDEDESENNVVWEIAAPAFLVLLIILVVLFLIRCCVRRSQNRVRYVALLKDPPPSTTGGDSPPEILQYKTKKAK